MLGKWEYDLLRDSSGTAVVVSGATVTVQKESNGAFASLYSEQDPGSPGPAALSNPFTLASGVSTIAFFAEQDENYRIVISANGGAYTRTLRYQSVSTPPISHFVAESLLPVTSASLFRTALGASSVGSDLFTAANAAAARAVIGCVIGTNVQAYSASLSSLASASTTNKLYYLSAANTWSEVTIGAGLDFTGGTLSSSAGNPESLKPVVCAVGLTMNNRTSSEDSKLDCSITRAGLFGSDNVAHIYSTLSNIIDIAQSGPSGLDTGAEGSSRWYHVHLIARSDAYSAQSVTASSSTDKITLTSHHLVAGSVVVFGGTAVPTGLTAGTSYYARDIEANAFKVAATPGGTAIDLTTNGTSVTITEKPALLISESATAPTMPTGYNRSGYVGAVYNDGSSNFIRIEQRDNDVAYTTNRSIMDGGFSTSSWTSISVSAFYPPTAVRVFGSFGSAGVELGVSPYSSGAGGCYGKWGAAGSTQDWGSAVSTARTNWMPLFSILYKATIYYWTAHANSTLVATGWKY